MRALIALAAAQHLAATHIRQRLEMRWRRALTDQALDRWLSNKAFWHRDPSLGGETLDNPDQRIAEDCRFFVETMLQKVLGFFTSLVGLASYVAVLWGLSTFALSVTILGQEVEISRYMVWAAPLYVLAATGLTHWLGAPLQRLAFEQERREADFRFALARLRGASAAVALSDGEPAERRVLAGRFAEVVANWRRLIDRELILGCFTRPYHSTVLRIPVFLALPAYLAGQVTLGGLMQLASAFQNVVTTLSWFIFNYRTLAHLAAAVARLDNLLEATERTARARPGPTIVPSPDEAVHLEGVRLRTPAGRLLVRIDRLTLAPGRPIWISGVSGLGKSTLLKAMAGLWPYGEGRIAMPTGVVRFMPQQPYLPLGDLATAAVYPLDARLLPRGQLEALMRDVGLSGRNSVLDDENGAAGLSVGEQQRLALLRLLVMKPDWVFLDEATSALDLRSEAEIHACLRKHLPQTTIVTVAHREPRGLPDFRRIDLERPGDAPGDERARDAAVDEDAGRTSGRARSLVATG